MKAKLFIFMTLFALGACDVPQRTRYPSSSDIDISKATEKDPPKENVDPDKFGQGNGAGEASQDYGPGFDECNLRPKI